MHVNMVPSVAANVSALQLETIALSMNALPLSMFLTINIFVSHTLDKQIKCKKQTNLK